MSNTARRTAITYPNGRVVILGYGEGGSIENAFGLVKAVAIEGESGDKVDYTRVGLGRYVKIAYPQPGVELSMIRPGGGSEGDSGDPYDGFDRFSRVQEMRWQGTASVTPIDAWQWGYNEASNRTWKKNLVAAGGQDEANAYDGLSQVIRDAVGTLNTNRTAIGGIPSEEEDFTYDPTGNWLGYRKDEDGSPVLDQSRSNNKDNQLTQIDGSSQGIDFDRAGNATKLRPGAGGDWSKEFVPVWDAWNRLVEVKDENGVTVQKNAYDGLSRRITKESGGKVVHTYWSDRWKPLEERVDSATTASRQYLWGERPGHRDELVLRDRDTNEDGTLDERLYATMDYFNGTSILDTSGNVLERYAYAAFGPRRVMASDFTSRGGSLYDWDFGFQGQLRDAETGWYNYGYRFYVPLLGRWVNRDPIGERGGINLYRYATNAAVNSLEWLGLRESGGPLSFSDLIASFARSDAEGRQLLKDWLFGDGSKKTYNWERYLQSDRNLKQRVKEFLIEKAKADWCSGQGLGTSVLRFHVDVTPGEDATGYNFLGGSNAKVGDFELHVDVQDRKDLRACCGLHISIDRAIFHDIADPNFQYKTDSQKYNIAKRIPFATLRNFEIEAITVSERIGLYLFWCRSTAEEPNTRGGWPFE